MLYHLCVIYHVYIYMYISFISFIIYIYIYIYIYIIYIYDFLFTAIYLRYATKKKGCADKYTCPIPSF